MTSMFDLLPARMWQFPAAAGCGAAERAGRAAAKMGNQNRAAEPENHAKRQAGERDENDPNEPHQPAVARAAQVHAWQAEQGQDGANHTDEAEEHAQRISRGCWR